MRLYRRAKRAEEIERADTQHENRGLTFWHEDDGDGGAARAVPARDGGAHPRRARCRDAGTCGGAASGGVGQRGFGAGGRPTWDVSTRPIPRRCDATDTDVPESVAAHRREDAEVFLTDVPRGTFNRGPSRTVRRADALAWMAERVFEPGDAPALAPDRHEIVVHVEADVLADGRAGRCEIEHRTAIAAETARRLCCDAGIVPVADGPDGEPLSVGRRTRSIPPAVRRALASRDRGCRFPGCPATHRLHGHHIRHWADGGETSLDNLILLCPTHHRLVHEGGFDVRAPRRRRIPVHQSAWVDHQTTDPAGDILAGHHHRPEPIPRACHRLRDCDRALARRAHRLRPRLDGHDGVVGFGRHPPGGGTGGGGLESVVGENRRVRGWLGSRHERAQLWPFGGGLV